MDCGPAAFFRLELDRLDLQAWAYIFRSVAVWIMLACLLCQAFVFVLGSTTRPSLRGSRLRFGDSELPQLGFSGLSPPLSFACWPCVLEDCRQAACRAINT